MRSLPLWRRNVLGGVVTAAAVAVLAVVDLAPPWTRYQATREPAHVVAPRGAVTIDGQRWSLGSVRHLGPGARRGVPRLPGGTVLTVVTVDRSGPAPPDQFCGASLVQGDTRWRGETFGIYAAPLATGAGIDCRRPGALQWSFLLPGDAAPTALDVTAPDGVILVRLEL
jgi:hypothetical protein